MPKLPGIKGFDYKRLAQGFGDEEFSDSDPGEYDPMGLPKAPARFSLSIPGHGGFTFGLGSDEFADLSKEELIQLVISVYDGGDRQEQFKQDPEYWMQFPKIALVALVSDTHGGGR